MIIRKVEKRPGRPPNRSDETLTEIDMKERLAALERQANPPASQGPYNIVQIFEAKWQTRMHGPSHHTAHTNVQTIEQAKRLGEAILANGYPTAAVQIHDVKIFKVVSTRARTDDDWTDRLF